MSTTDKKDDEYPRTQMTCLKGQVIFEQGAPSHQAFLIEEGKVELTMKEDDHEIVLAHLGVGELFGEMGVLENEERMAKAIAMEKSVIKVISRREIEDRLEKVDDEIVRSVLHSLMQRLRDSNRGQLNYYKNLASFQERMAGLMLKAKGGVDRDKRDNFSAEITPLLDQIDTIFDKYKG